ncbi:hypothetical protein [Pseudonocardia sp. NPDC049154]|uniref:hypothetical protein n=1 Tax=Pseudonocardia sp. NPDC049154 TaxID=3155501 RepID=UPI0033C8E303
MKIGFTGTRLTPTDPQSDALTGLLAGCALWYGDFELHHGDCVGADALAARIAKAHDFIVHVHPPTEQGMRAWTAGHVMHEPLPYLERNRAIVDATECLIAVPDGPERTRSGTWSTVRYARRLGRPVTIVWPDGRVET